MTVILAFADLIFAKSASTGTPIINFCFCDFNFREWYQDSRNLNPTKIMPYTVIPDVNHNLRIIGDNVKNNRREY